MLTFARAAIISFTVSACPVRAAASNAASSGFARFSQPLKTAISNSIMAILERDIVPFLDFASDLLPTRRVHNRPVYSVAL
jgi:hypothetical protein